MRIDEYISGLRNKGIVVSVQNERLAVSASDEVLTSEVVTELKSKKQEILDFFKSIQKTKQFKSVPKALESESYPLSTAQRRMYFLYELDKYSVSYNIPSFFRVGRNLDIAKFDKTLKELVKRHKSLRTIFENENGHLIQRVVKANRFEVNYVHGNSSEIDSYVKSFVKPFDLAKDLPYRVSLFDIAGEDYLLMIDSHHIINDGVSNDILMHDFWALYHEKPLIDTNIDYIDYAVWQQSEEYQSLVSSHKSYWLDKYNEDLTAIDLPLDYSRSKAKNSKGGTYSIELSSTLSAKIRLLASRKGVTTYTFFLSIYNILLSKLSNQRDIVVGTPTAGRHHSDLEGLVGMFVNTLALRNCVDSSLKFRDFLQKIQTDTALAFDHQLYQYQELVDALEVPRDTERNPLFDVFYSYNYDKRTEDIIKSDELNFIAHDVEYDVSKFDLELDILDKNEKFGIYFNYNFSLFKEDTIIKFTKYFEKIITQVLLNEEVSISKIDVLSREDKNQIVYEFNKPELGYNVNGTIINLIEEQVSLNPELIALYFGESEMSYDELNCKVNQLTHYLIKVMGIKKGDRIGLYQGRSPELIIGFLAILKSGAIYVPLDPDNPKDRISTLIKDSEMKLIITNNSNNELLTMMSSVEVVDLIARSKEIKNMSEANPLVSIQGNDSAYIIYTSGSTGKPKGVVITHDSLLDYSITFKNYFSLSLIDKVVQQASPAFDTVIEEIFPALLSGASIVIIKEGGRDINSLIKSIKQYKATVLSSVPVVLDTLNNYVDELKSLRVIISGGDLLLPRHINKLINNFDIYNTYGPSESTVCITYHKINSLENTSCIGKPIENRQVYILNNDNQLCPIGVTGELCVSGKGLAKEYLNDIVSTNNKFLENPIISGARMYRTGDAAKWNSDGSIEFLGRVDDQVKIRGVRIELGEIESCLESLSGVNQSLVLAQELEGNKQLVAYLCGDKRLEDNEIRISLSSKLPNYMLPTTFMWLEKFPLNTNGKIDRRSLPVPYFISGQEYVAPSNEIEASLVVIWSEVLGLELDKISVTSDFFQLGGHSLNAITVANKLSEIFSVDVPLRELFTYRTISDLSVYIDSLDKSTFISIPKSDYQEYYPLSSAQRRMYFLYELDKEGTSYNMPSFYRVSRDLDVSQFNKSIEILVERHKSLRTVFELVEGSPVQRILDLNEFEVVCQQGNSEDVEDFVRDFVRPFDLSSEVPYRVCLVDVIGEDYLLMIDTHHIINDGVSNEVLMRDFWSLYQGKELSNNKVDYIDYAVWQQGSDHQELISSHKSYWLDLYDSSIASLELPIDYSRPKIQSDEGGVYSFTFDESQSLALRSLALKEGVTMYGLFLGLYNVLLSKLSNQEDIVVGTPTSGRNHSDIEDVVGMFVNTLALRTEVDSSKGFTAFLQELQSNTLDAFDHQLYQYEDLVDALGVSRDTGRNPLFDVFYSYAQGEVNSEIADSEGLIIKGHEVAYDIAKFDLSLQVEERECIGFSFNYRKDLFKESTIVQFSSYLVRIVTSVLNDASVLLRDIDILSQEEKDRLLLEFNNTSEAYDLGETVLDMFSKRVSESPDSEALVFEGASMSYKELDVRSDVWASHLVSEGVASGDIVGLMMTRSFDMVTGVLAILKSGGAYLPINIDQPISRTDYMLKECNVSLIITNIESSLGELKNDYECLTSTELDTYELLEENILPNVKVDDLAYVIYTSGSTGRPKGVMIKYKGITNLNCFQKDFFGIDSRDRILQFSPYYFDASVEQIWLALTSGATMVLVRKDFLLEIDRFKDYLAENKVTYIHATPSFLENLPIDELSTLRVVVSGGEKCSSSLVNKFIDKLTFINEYGPTEGTVVSTAFKVLGNLNRNIPIGRPIANTQAYVLNKDLNLLPERTIGELYVGGAGLAKGYINNEELTSERFIDNPYGSGKIYKTGDIVKWLSDGSLEYLGRNDNQVKIRGYRIELGEIESLLEELPSISQSLVLAQGPEGNKQLVAYLCGDKQLENNEIRTSLSSKLPNYMLPTTFIWLEKFPLNANGKIDRRSLPVPDFTSGQEYVAPTNKAEDSLVGIWSEVLGLESEKISVTSDFFQLGGHSLNAITVANKLSEIFSVDVPLRDLFTYRTISELSVHILEKERVEFESIPKAEYQEYYPLSSAQRRMYFLYEFDKESTSYNMPAFYRVSRDLDVSQLNKSIKALVERHKSLRTVFELSEGQPVQRILDASNFEIDYGQGESIGIKDYVKDFVRPFNLAEDLPYRVSLLDISGEDYLLMVDTHHIINDGVSNEILLRDFWSLYQGNDLSNNTIDYIDYSVWQQSFKYQELVGVHKSYWLDRYSEDLTALELPTDYSRPQILSNEGGVHSITLDEEQSTALRLLAASEGVTMYTMFLGIYNILLSKLSNQEDIVVGTPTAGRHHSDLEDVVGMFVNTLALRNQVISGISFQEFLRELQSDTLMAFDHQLYQYEELVDALDVSRETNRNPLFDVFYSYGQGKVSSEVGDSEGLVIKGHDVGYNVAKFDLSLNVFDGDSIELSLSYRTDLFTPLSIARFSGYLNSIIESVLEDKESLLKDIDVLSASEKERLLLDLNDTSRNYNLNTTVLNKFMAQAFMRPDGVALVFGEEKLTYQELDARSDLWASHLINLGVEKGSIVGLMMTRSTEMITAILGIMKAGGAYLPINPDQPFSRTEYMLEECEVTLILGNVSREDFITDLRYTFIEAVSLDRSIDTNERLPFVSASDLAYVIYTSGSTGNPKGVMIEHRSVTNLIKSQQDFFRFNRDEKILQFSPYYFDASVEQIWLGLSTGAILVMVEEEMLIEGKAFTSYLKEQKITHFHSTPSFLERIDFNNVSTLRRIVSGGEVCKDSLAEKLSRSYDFYNEYGPTETTVTSTIFKVEDNNVSIGRPIANTQAYVLDKDLNLLPEGVVGELYLGGVGLSSGYINNLALTEERFISNPFGEGRLYKTGDLVRWLPEGDLEYLGRNDYQVKLRGYRIELGEIESFLEEIPSIDQALVLARGSEENKQLIAYVCSRETIEEQDIIGSLTERLPDYMIPTGYIQLESFPLNANGKIDRKSLPVPDLTAGEEYVSPSNETEVLLVSIWSEVLGLEESSISVNSDFFRLGGHSLLAITLLNKVNQYFNVEVALRDLFRYRTVLELSIHILEKDHVEFESIPKALESGSYPLSSAQRRMYFLYEFDKDGTSYNMPAFYRVGRELDVSKLDKTFKELVSRHQVLRTVFELSEGQPVQRVLDASTFEITYRQGSSAAIDSYVSEFVRPFNLAEDLPYRVSLIDISGEDYLLMIDTHHIINDGVSNEILTNDFWSLYHGASLPDLSVEYVDYSVWQQSENYQSLVSSHKDYWLDRYTEELTVLELPTDYSRSQIRSNEGGVHSITLSEEQSQGLRKIAASEGVTMYTLFLGIYNVLLSKLSNQEDIVVGTPTAGRHHADLEGVVGMFVNTLALRNQVASGSSFKEFLTDLQVDTLMAFDHQLYQYEELVDALDVSRDSSRNPLFDVFYSYGQDKVTSIVSKSEELSIVGHDVGYDVAKFDLSLNVLDSEEITLSLTYRTDLFSALSILKFSDYLNRVIDSVVDNKERLLKDIDILSVSEKDRLLLDLNDTDKAYNLNTTVLNKFMAQSFTCPDGIALVLGEEKLTYQELDVRSDLWARHLMNLGVVKGSIVGLMMTRSTEMITAILGVMKAGGAYLPINPDQPVSRTHYMLAECNVELILGNISKVDFKEDLRYTFIETTSLDLVIDTNDRLPLVEASDLAYIIYTSGSTGKPKGVMVEHKSVTNLIDHEREFLGVNITDKILQFSPYYFDVSVEQIWLALTTGSSLILLEKETLLDRQKFLRLLEDEKITHLNVTPSFLESLLLPNLKSLKRIVVSGETCKPSLAKQYIDRYDFYNEYGPTESTVISVSKRLNSEDLIEGNVSIGRPIANTQAYVLDKDLNLLPEGVVGELYLGGVGLSSGYINNLALTEERFISNPFGEGRLYKTGDLVRWLPEGDLEYLGRNDYQVKLRGYRIELGEIESFLEEIPSIDQALVLAHGSEENKQLIAYVCSRETIEEQDIIGSLTERLPDYMIPTGYIQLESFPLNANGKIDRKSLPVPDLTVGEEYVSPSNETEVLLVSIWSEVLGLEESSISVNSDFFRSGGHSLLAITLLNKVNQYFNVEVALRDLFRYRTVLELSIHILEKDHVEFESIPKALESGSYPLSSAQRRMYFLYEFDKDGTSYNMPAFYRVGRELDVSKLDKTFKELVSRHQVLRTVFELSEGQPVQRVLDASTFEITYRQGSSAAIDSYVSEFVRPFNLAEDLPYRVSLIDISGEDYLLMIDTHHIINDGVSNEILTNDFWSLYHGASLPDLSVEYVDYSVWQQSENYQSLVSSHKDYWLDRYTEELTVLELPTDYSRSQIRSNEGGVHSITLSEEQSQGLRKIAASEGVTMYTLFLGIYNVLLSKLSNQEDIVVGTPTAGRHHTDLEGVVGMFVNTLALRNQVASGSSFKEFLTDLQVDTLMAFDHQLYQYEELVDALDVSRDSSRNPLFDVFYSYGQDKVTSIVSKSEELSIVGHDVGYDVAKFDLSLNVLDSEEITLSLTYRTDLFSALSILKFSDYLNRVIDSVVDNKERLLKDIDILSVSEKDRLLLDLNDTDKAYNLNTTVLNKFMAQSFTCPDGIALVLGEEKLTYQELDVRSDLWARHLMNLGVVKGSIVGLMMTRSTEMITAILGVMKAGGAYLPINPDQPVSRTHYMLAECNVELILGNISKVDFKEDLRYTFIETTSLDLVIDTNDRLPLVEASDLAYIIYTSGSTGKPKGVMVEHKSVTNLIDHEREFLGVNITDKILQFSPYYFDVSVEQIWLALTTGSSLILLEKETLLDRQKFLRLLEDEKITHLNVTPSFLESLLLPNLKSLKRIVVSGETCKPSLAKQYIDRYDFYNEYGPTESTVISVSKRLNSEDLIEGNVSIGRPIANTQAYVLDKDLNLLPEGVVGELYLGGVGLSSGYINNLALTEERFISNPFGEGRLYKTGDLVRWLPEGDLEYLGRNDYQVKLRGYRIELGEIESELENIESISQSIVIALGSEENQQLVAYLCGERELESNEVRLLLSSKLPDYMIPTSYVWLESFPVNANGKLDKRLLPTPDLTIGDEYVAPSNKIQKKLVSVWSEVLGIEEEKISVISDFFRLGGHSLSAMKMKHEINKYFKVEILLSEVFLAPTIISLSSKIEEEEIKEKENLTIIPLNKRETEEKLFIIHDGSGEIDGYLELTRNIQGHQCYGIRFNNELSSLSLESIASMYIEEIKSIQKTGPYKLLGWSLGGVIATEMVLQLEKLNERVEKLIVIDSHFNYEKPLYKTSFNIDSELELLSSNFGFYSKKREKIRSLKNLYSEFMESDFYKQLPIEEIQDIIPQELKQLIPDFFNKDKNELFKATGKIRSLITASDNYWINRNVAANTLFIRPIKSSNTIDIDELEKTFINLCIKNTSGDHFSIMKNIEAKILSTIVDNHLELTLV